MTGKRPMESCTSLQTLCFLCGVVRFRAGPNRHARQTGSGQARSSKASAREGCRCNSCRQVSRGSTRQACSRAGPARRRHEYKYRSRECDSTRQEPDHDCPGQRAARIYGDPACGVARRDGACQLPERGCCSDCGNCTGSSRRARDDGHTCDCSHARRPSSPSHNGWRNLRRWRRLLLREHSARGGDHVGHRFVSVG